MGFLWLVKVLSILSNKMVFFPQPVSITNEYKKQITTITANSQKREDLVLQHNARGFMW